MSSLYGDVFWLGGEVVGGQYLVVGVVAKKTEATEGPDTALVAERRG